MVAFRMRRMQIVCANDEKYGKRRVLRCNCNTQCNRVTGWLAGRLVWGGTGWVAEENGIIYNRDCIAYIGLIVSQSSKYNIQYNIYTNEGVFHISIFRNVSATLYSLAICMYIQKTSWMAKEFIHPFIYLVNPIDLGLESSLVSSLNGNHSSQQYNSSDMHTEIAFAATCHRWGTSDPRDWLQYSNSDLKSNRNDIKLQLRAYIFHFFPQFLKINNVSFPFSHFIIIHVHIATSRQLTIHGSCALHSLRLPLNLELETETHKRKGKVNETSKLNYDSKERP